MDHPIPMPLGDNTISKSSDFLVGSQIRDYSKQNQSVPTPGQKAPLSLETRMKFSNTIYSIFTKVTPSRRDALSFYTWYMRLMS
jgi:hypothetical protein